MNSRAIKDYFRSFHWKKLYSPELFMFYFWLLLGPNMYWDKEYRVMEVFLIYYSGAITLLLGMSGMHLNPVRLPKLMYLLPMNRQQREDYVRTRFWIRFLAPALAFVIVRGIAWIIYPAQIFYLLIDVMYVLGLFGGSCLTVGGKVTTLEASKDQPKFLREKEIKGIDGKGLLVFLIGVVAWFIGCMCISEKAQPHWVVTVLTALVLVWQVWLSVKMIGHVKYMIPYVCDYERMNG